MDKDLIKNTNITTFNKGEMRFMVLEPDFLQNATSISKYDSGFSDIQWILNTFSKEIVVSIPVIIGNIVGDISAKYVSNRGNIDLEAEVERHIDEVSVDLKIIGEKDCLLALQKIGNTQTGDIKFILKNEILKQVSNLIDFFSKDKLSHILTEVELISLKYGIRGRADFMFCYGETNIYEKSNFFELKTSKPPREEFGFWTSNGLQVKLYDMMSETMHGRHGGTSGVLYSRAENVFRPIDYSVSDEIKLMEIRNNIVYNSILTRNGCLNKILEIAKEDLKTFSPPVYMRDAIKRVKKFFRKNTFSHELIERASFLEKEIEYNSHIFSTGLCNFKNQRQSHNTAAIFNIKFIETIHDAAYFTYEKKDSDIREGARVLIFNMKDISNAPYFIGTINFLSKGKFKISSKNNLKGLKKNTDYLCCEDFSSLSINKLQASVFHFLSSDIKHQNVYFGEERPSQSRTESVLLAHDSLNKKQKSALKKAIVANDYCLIQGPPGSGKTELIAEIIKELSFNKKSILLTAYTNSAVDNVIDRISDKNINIVRLEGSKIKCGYNELIKSDIIASTIHGLIFNKVFKVKIFDCVIIEEAGQLLDEHIMYILSCVKKIIFLGDHMQLPPIVMSTDIDKGYNYKKSIFERLFEQAQRNNWDFAFEALNEQYRMPPGISNFVAKFFYNDNLSSTIKNEAGDGIYFYDIVSNNRGKINKDEALAVVTLIKNLKNYENIGVVVPFRAQAAIIKDLLLEQSIGGVDVDTVERFQGREKDFIIFSTVANTKETFDKMTPCKKSLKDKKLNVAISRAKKRLYIFGNSSILKTRDEYRVLIDHYLLN